MGPAGEHFVLFKLHLEGMLAALAPRNAPSVDVMVLNGDETIAATVQVKTRTYGSDGGCHMKDKHEHLVRPTSSTRSSISSPARVRQAALDDS